MAELGSVLVENCMECPFGYSPPLAVKLSCSQQPNKKVYGFSQLSKLFKTCPLRMSPVLVELRDKNT